MNYLNDGVLFEILARLPVKSLLRFKCVDRRWNSLISGPRFVKAQARWTANTSQRIVLCDNRSHVSISFEDIIVNGWQEDSALRIDELDILCSCHGLECLLDDLNRLYLYNPATITKWKLPKHHYHERDNGFIGGLGYDTLNDDYKLVIGTPERHCRVCNRILHIFSLRSNSWKSIGGLNILHNLGGQGKYSNGFLHWLRGGYGECIPGIVSLDIATEQLHEDLLPMPAFTHPGWFTNLGVTECGWLIIYHKSPNALEVWIMKDSSRGSNSTWTKLYYITDEQLKYDHYLSWFPWVRNGKIFLLAVLQRGDCIVIYDPEEKCLKTIQVPKKYSPLYDCYGGIPHVLSLLPPHV